jgi:phosphoenolpyruvate carboxylase
LAAELSMQQASDALREGRRQRRAYRAVLKQLRDRLRATRAWAALALASNRRPLPTCWSTTAT